MMVAFREALAAVTVDRKTYKKTLKIGNQLSSDSPQVPEPVLGTKNCVLVFTFFIPDTFRHKIVMVKIKDKAKTNIHNPVLKSRIYLSVKKKETFCVYCVEFIFLELRRVFNGCVNYIVLS